MHKHTDKIGRLPRNLCRVWRGHGGPKLPASYFNFQAAIFNRHIAMLALLGLLAGAAQAATVTSTGSGNWDDAAIWSGGTPAGNDVTISSGHTVTTTGLLSRSANSLTIDGTLTHAAETSTSTAIDSETQRLFLNVGGNLTITSEGKIDVSGMGYNVEKGPGSTTGTGGGGYGGQGGGSGGTTYGSVTNPVNSGSGGKTYGGVAGRGGGVVVLAIGGDLTLNGSVLSNGGSPAYGGGGSGGGINIVAARLFGTGTLSANGGNVASGAPTGDGGGGGRIAVILTNADNAAFANLTAIITFGGSPKNNGEYGAAGTIYIKGANQTYGTLIVNNNGKATSRTTLFQPSTNQFDTIITTYVARFALGTNAQLTMNGTAWLSDTNSRIIVGVSTSAQIIASTLTIPTNATLSWSGTNGFTLNSDVTVANGGTLTHESITTDPENHKLIANIVGNLTIASGGKIYVSAKGFKDSQGPGKGGTGRGGGGHGGEGGGSVGGTTYDSITDPTRAGSGGGDYAGGADNYGGGVVQLRIAGALTNNGSIAADGVGGGSDGYPAGGSVNIVAASLSGGGTISANGGGAASGGGSGGGGGRIAVILTNANDTALYGLSAISAYGGQGNGGGYEHGAAGTFYLKGTNTAYGRLIVDNNRSASKRTLVGPQVTDATVGDVWIRNQGYMSITGGPTLTVYGSWSNAVATNGIPGGTVVLAGASPATVWGSNTWSNLTITTAGKVVYFETNKVQTITGTPTFDNYVTLRSTVDGVRWIIAATSAGGTQYVGKVSAKDSLATNDFFKATGGSDLGNTYHWLFPARGTVMTLR